jgi:hypothetical protein
MQCDRMINFGAIYPVSKEEAIDIANIVWRGSVTAKGRARETMHARSNDIRRCEPRGR